MECSTSDVRVVPLPTCQDVLTQILRQGAQTMLAQAIEAEVQDWIEQRTQCRDEHGRQQVVRNGFLPERTVLTGLGALKENRSLGSLTVLRPVQSLPSFGGTRRDSDGRLATFLQGWAFAYRDSGRARAVILEAMNRFGLDVNTIPPEVQF